MNLDWRLLRQAWAARLYLGLTIGTGLLAAAVTVLQAHFLSRVVAAAFLSGKTLPQLSDLLIALLVVIVVRAALLGAREVTGNRAAGLVKGMLRERLYGHLLNSGPAFVQGERTGELANTLVEGVESLDAYIAQYLPNLALAALIPLTFLAFVFPFDLVSGLVLLVTAPLIPLFMVLIGQMADHLTQRQWESLRRLSAHFADVLQGLTTLKVLGRSKQQTEAIERVSRQSGETTLGVLRVAFLSALVLEMLATVSTAIVAVEVGLRLLYGMLGFEQAFFVLILAPEFYLPLRSLGASFHAGKTGLAAAQRIYELLDEADGAQKPRSLLASEQAKAAVPVRDSSDVPAMEKESQPFSVPIGSIRLRDVVYAYDDGKRPALCNVSFTINVGEKVALVGPSGAGKTTIAHLLLRFLKPDSGEILVDGRPLGAIPIEEWRARVAWVSQRPHLFHGTVADNIRLGRPDAGPDQVAQAARAAHADEFIRALPLGYNTPIGEHGARLSGGQAQRIALARAFLKNALFLILDEAAANLDAEQEALLQVSIGRLLQGRSVLIIAHRLATVRAADRIVVLDRGRVVEIGDHPVLLSNGGLYRRLVSAYEAAL